MGAWGTGVLSDDTVRDVYDSYLDLFNRGNPPEVIRQKLLEDFEKSLGDSDDGPLIWLGIAKAQWDCDQLEPLVLQRVRKIVSEGPRLTVPALFDNQKLIGCQNLGGLTKSSCYPFARSEFRWRR